MGGSQEILAKKRPYSYLAMFFKEFIFMSMQSINNFCENLGQSVFNCEICEGSEKERTQILLLRRNYQISSIFLK